MGRKKQNYKIYPIQFSRRNLLQKTIMQKDIYTITVSIKNKHGEILERDYGFETINEAYNAFEDGLLNDFFFSAEKYAKERGMYLEELYDSKEDAEFDLPDTYDGTLGRPVSELEASTPK